MIPTPRNIPKYPALKYGQLMILLPDANFVFNGGFVFYVIAEIGGRQNNCTLLPILTAMTLILIYYFLKKVCIGINLI